MIFFRSASVLRRLFSLSLALGLATFGSLPAAEAPPAPRLVAGAVCEKGDVQRDEVRTETGGIVFEARPLPVSDWEARLERRLQGMGAALKRHDGSPGPFQVFLLSIRNQSAGMLRFQPGNIVRLLGDREQDHILDFTDLYRYMVEEGKDADSLNGIRDIFYDSGFELEPAASVERLLFFRPLPEKGKKKQLVLLMSSFQTGTETLQAGLAWHFEKEKK
jgi:hypothetical protein